MRFLLQMLLATTPLATAVPLAVPDPAAPPSEMIATASDLANRMTLPTRVNGHGPYRFTIDTGADHSVVSDRLVSELGIAPGASSVIFGIVGPQTVSTVSLAALRIGRRERHDVRTAVLPQGSLGAAGFIGLDALAQESVLFDFKRNRVTIAQSGHDETDRDPDTIVVVGKNRFGQLILTDADIRGTKIYAIIDTGAENTIGNLALRKLMGRTGPLDDHGGRLIGVTGASLPAEFGTVPHIRLGKMNVAHMPIAYADVATFRKFGVDQRPAILIGMDVLRGFDQVAVDFRRREVRFHIGDNGLALNQGTPALPAG